MKRGKHTCKILKEIRKQIAEENDIEFITSECHFHDDCLGTCPKCEAELRYLEQELEKRTKLGKTAVIAGLSVGLLGSLAGCQEKPANTGSEPADRKPAQTDIDSRYSDSLSNPNLSEPMPVNNTPGYIENKNCENNKNKSSTANSPVELNVLEGDVITIKNDIFPDTSEFDFLAQLTDSTAAFPDETALYLLPEEQPEYHEIYSSELMGDIIIEKISAAEFPGGEDSLYSFLRARLKYPEMAKKNNIQGVVLTEFIVKKDGTIGNIKVVKPLFPECDEEAIRVIKLMPKWKPGKQLGKPVRTYFNLPVRFSLED